MSKPQRLLTLVIGSLLLLAVSYSHAADHLDAPLLQVSGVGDRDINDLYAFQSPNDANNSVLIMTVNPFAGVLSGTTFGTDVIYELQIDNSGDSLPDLTYSATFSTAVGSSQPFAVTRNGTPFASGNTEMNIPIATGGTLRAGLFDDPFFFDLAGFQNGFAFTGNDAFAGADVSAIVLEVPSSELGTAIGVSARTVVNGIQVDRIGRPAINTALIPAGRKDAFNQASPDQDLAEFGAEVQATIEFLNGGDATTAASLTGVLLPDLLTFNTADASGFLNGRQLADDVIDAELNLLSSGMVTGDGVPANDVPFLDVFPYLAPIPEPSGIALVAFGLVSIGHRRLMRQRAIESNTQPKGSI